MSSDETKSLDALLTEHSASIAALRSELGADLPAYFDEIWLLRYVLSFDVLAERIDAAKKCIKWRGENAAMLADAAAGRPAPHHEIVKPYLISGFHPPTKALLGEPLFIVRSGVSNPTAVMNILTPEQVISNLMFSREVAFIQCDAETRKQRRLVKMITMIHMEFATSGFDRRFFNCLSASGKISEFVYPQQLLKSVMFRPPSFFFSLFALFKPLFTKKMLEKQAMCPGRSPEGISACPFAKKHFDVASLPTIVGGECTCEERGGCICGMSNSVTTPKKTPEIEGGGKKGWLW
jgi:hypothetical protein